MNYRTCSIGIIEKPLIRDLIIKICSMAIFTKKNLHLYFQDNNGINIKNIEL